MQTVDRLRKIHLAEVVQLSKSVTVVGKIGGLRETISMLRQYIKYLAYTWVNVLRNVVFLCFSPVELVLCICFALGASVVMTVLLFSCIFGKLPYVEDMFKAWSRKHANSLSPVNAPCNIFRKISKHQVDVAKVALQQPHIKSEVPGERIFNLDIAKLLMQLAALMYERGSQPIHSAVAAGHAHGISPSTAGKSAKNVNLPSPPEPPNGPLSLHPPAVAVAANAINDKLHNNETDSAILDFCHEFGLEYAAMSELNACDSAYSALFWDPSSNWIVLAFKGTSPTEFTEWVSDFTYTSVDAGDWLPGFNQAGFLERIFPSNISESPGTRPWDTILKGVKVLAEGLLENNRDPNAKVNLYLTGHSLGCAIASLAFARLALVESDLDERIILRDGYLFAAPIVCDAKSVKAFDGAINKHFDMPKTLWRVTNKQRKDVVATGLPDFGDRQNSLFASSPYSLLNFAHLGAEIKMRSKPVPCRVVGWPHITRGVPVLATSSLHPDMVGTLKVNEGVPESLMRLEQLPFLGRIVQHASFCYWFQLERVGTGECNWDA